MPPQTVAEAAALLRRVADDREAWADETAKVHGEHSVQGDRHLATWFRTAASVIESGDYRGFSYGTE